MQILVTGGAGYIGSHVALELLTAGNRVVVLDNLSNASRTAVPAIRRIAGGEVGFVEGDVRDRSALDAALKYAEVQAVIHCAGFEIGRRVHGTASALLSQQCRRCVEPTGRNDRLRR